MFICIPWRSLVAVVEDSVTLARRGSPTVMLDRIVGCANRTFLHGPR